MQRIVPLVLGRSRQDRIGAYVAIAPGVVLGAAGFAAAILVYDAVTRIGL